MNLKFCVTPVNLYHRDMIVQWLDTKVNQGLFPTKIGAFLSVFTARAELDCKFYLEPRARGQREPTLSGRAGTAAWTYLCPISKTYFLFSAPKSAPAPEDELKEQTQIEAWKRETKRNLIGAIILPVIILMLVVIAAALFFHSKWDIQPDALARVPLLLFNLCNPILIILVLYLIGSSAFDYKDSRTLSAASSPRLVRRNGLALVLSVVLLLFGISTVLHTRDTPIEAFSAPYIPLSELEDVPLTSWENLYGAHASHASDNKVDYLSSLLAPRAYLISQNYYETTSKNETHFSPAGAPDHYAPSLDTAYMQLLFPALSRPIAESQIDQFRLVNLQWTYRDVSYEGLDFVILAHVEGDVWQMAALGRGNRIAVFRYAGLQKLEDHIPTLATLVIS